MSDCPVCKKSVVIDPEVLPDGRIVHGACKQRWLDAQVVDGPVLRDYFSRVLGMARGATDSRAGEFMTPLLAVRPKVFEARRAITVRENRSGALHLLVALLSRDERHH